MGQVISLIARDGNAFDAYLATPASKPRGAIVVVQEIFGVNAHIRDVADGYAAEGYIAVAPALYDRITKHVELGYQGDDLIAGRAYRQQVSREAALADIAAAVAKAAESGKVGIVGYCWGGLLSWLAAAELPGLAAAVSYYGGTIGQNLDLVPKIPVMLHFGARDQHIPLTDAEELQRRYPQAIVHVYDADHGFNCDHRASYDKPSADLALARSLEFFGKYLG